MRTGEIIDLIQEYEDEKKSDLYSDWKKLVNMSASEIEKFLDSEEGEDAGLSRKEASKLDISRGRDSARAIVRMKDKGKDDWSSNDWEWAQKQVSFISRMKGNEGPLFKDGKMTRKMKSLLIWGHDPRK